jgi:hypothetical protein
MPNKEIQEASQIVKAELNGYVPYDLTEHPRLQWRPFNQTVERKHADLFAEAGTTFDPGNCQGATFHYIGCQVRHNPFYTQSNEATPRQRYDQFVRIAQLQARFGSSQSVFAAFDALGCDFISCDEAWYKFSFPEIISRCKMAPDANIFYILANCYGTVNEAPYSAVHSLTLIKSTDGQVHYFNANRGSIITPDFDSLKTWITEAIESEKLGEFSTDKQPHPVRPNVTRKFTQYTLFCYRHPELMPDDHQLSHLDLPHIKQFE